MGMDKTHEIFDLEKPIQVRLNKGSKSIWYDAEVVSVWADIVEDQTGYRPALNLVCTCTEITAGTQILDAFGFEVDSWRYKEKCCEQCKWSSKEGGDLVPYGMGSVPLPEGYVCECPNMPEDFDDTYDKTNGGKNCEHHEFQ